MNEIFNGPFSILSLQMSVKSTFFKSLNLGMSLISMDLTGNKIDDAVIFDLSEVLMNNKTLVVLQACITNIIIT